MSENFSFLLTFLKEIQLSEHNATLTQVRTTYQKIATNQIWQLSKVNFELNSPCQMTQFFHNSLTLFCCEDLKKTLKLRTMSKYWILKRLGWVYRLKTGRLFLKTVVCKILWEKVRDQRKKIRQGRKTLISVLAYFWAPLPNIYLCRGYWTLGCFPKQILDFANVS